MGVLGNGWDGYLRICGSMRPIIFSESSLEQCYEKLLGEAKEFCFSTVDAECAACVYAHQLTDEEKVFIERKGISDLIHRYADAE